jgi:prepilin-type N-terminal cleavage/methylation domain-containing protein
MMERIHDRQRAHAAGEGGFTLIELLVVIVILGILAAVVVFSVAGIGDKGQASACTIDTRTIRTAEEASFANSTTAGVYANEAALVPNFLSQASVYHDVTANNAVTPPTYSITVADSRCGTVGNVVGTTAADK